MRAQQLKLDGHCEYYVVNLLTLYSRSEHFFEDRTDYFGLAPLAVMLREAEDAPDSDARTERLQRLGDVALFVAGCLSESLEDAPVDLNYYLSMGGGAYSSLSSEVRGRARGGLLTAVFAELAEKFAAVVAVVQQVFDAGQRLADDELVHLYRSFQTTGSLRARRVLEANNIVFLPSSRKRTV